MKYIRWSFLVVMFGLVAACQTTKNPENLNTSASQNTTVAVDSIVVNLAKTYDEQNLDVSKILTPIKGRLYKPEGTGPFPGVVVFHGCGGIKDNTKMWAKWFQERAVVALVVDGFTPRGIQKTCTNLAGKITRSTRLDDLYGGARYLAGLPFVNSEKIGVMGFSNGAGRALDAVDQAIYKRVEKTLPKLAFSIPLYPECRGRSYKLKAGPYFAPVLVLIGEKDDWTLAKTCQEAAAQTKSHKYPMDVIVYPGAHHAFDDVNQKLYYNPNWENPNSSTRRGGTVQGNGPATKAAKADVEIFLKQVGII